MGVIWVAVVAVWAVVFGLVVWAVCRLFPAQRNRDPRTVLEVRLDSSDIGLDTPGSAGHEHTPSADAQHNGRSDGGRARARESHEHIG